MLFIYQKLLICLKETDSLLSNEQKDLSKNTLKAKRHMLIVDFFKE